jgi:dynein heavy chain
VAVRVSRLFFVIAELQNVNPMYQYSLDFYRRIYMRALQASKKTKEGEENALKNKETRKQFYIKKFTKLLYKNVCRSLFETDKLLFSFLMSLKIMQEQGVYDSAEARFLMTGGNAVDSGDRPNPSGENGWLSSKQWA